jgi:hypothetical protein
MSTTETICILRIQQGKKNELIWPEPMDTVTENTGTHKQYI